MAAGPVGPEEAGALFAPCRGARHLLVGVSGGPDSMALAGLLARWARTFPDAPQLSLATVDHGLRPGATAEAEAVAVFARRLGLPHQILHWRGEKPARGLPAAARAARYALLEEHARDIGADRLLTAHTRDDQAETVLMRLAAGSGPAGLAGMRPQRRRGALLHLRPLLDLAKARLVATCKAEGWPHVEDPSNVDPRYTRARLRRLLPALEAEGLTPERLVRLAERQARANAALDALAEQALGPASRGAHGGLGFSAHVLAEVQAEILVRALALALRRASGEAGDARPLRLERLESLAGRMAEALAARRPLRASLGGCLVILGPEGALSFLPEPPRRRGRPASALDRRPAVHPARPTSLGNGMADA